MKRSIFVHEPGQAYPSKLYGNDSAVLQVEINEPLETLLKNDSRLVLKTDLPKPLEQEIPASAPVVPKTPLEVCNLLSYLSKIRFGIFAGQLLDEGYVTKEQFLNLWRRLTEIAQESDRLHQKILEILEHPRSPKAVAEASQK